MPKSMCKQKRKLVLETQDQLTVGYHQTNENADNATISVIINQLTGMNHIMEKNEKSTNFFHQDNKHPNKSVLGQFAS
jgi:hypothetical protein